MAHTEIQEKNGRKYYYRVRSFRDGNRIRKERVYLGADLEKNELSKMEVEADVRLNIFSVILSREDEKILEKIRRDFSKEPKENYENRYESFCSLFVISFHLSIGISSLISSHVIPFLLMHILPNQSFSARLFLKHFLA